MNKISNNVFEKSLVTHSCIYWENIFTSEKIESITQECERSELINGAVDKDAI